MGKSKCCSWFVRLCCCCCTCCEDPVKEDDPLLNSRSPSKEATPSRELAGISEVRVSSEDDGKLEVQMVVVNVNEEVKGQDTQVVPVPSEKPETPFNKDELAPSERARVDSGTFMRGSGSRSSWRMIPTVSQQGREAANAKEKAEKEEKRKSAILTSSSNLGDGAIVFSDEIIDEEVPKEKSIVLFPKEEEGGVAEDESVTMTFTISNTTAPQVNLVQKEVPKETDHDAKEEVTKKESDVVEEVPKKEVDEGFVND